MMVLSQLGEEGLLQWDEVDLLRETKVHEYLALNIFNAVARKSLNEKKTAAFFIDCLRTRKGS